MLKRLKYRTYDGSQNDGKTTFNLINNKIEYKFKIIFF